MRNQGPPPAYEIAVKMKNPMEMGLCHLCQNKVRMNCECDSRTDDELPTKNKRANDQFLNVQTMSQHHKLQQQTTSETCGKCDNELRCKNERLCDEDLLNGNCQEDEYCQCTNAYKYVPKCRTCGRNPCAVKETNNEYDLNDNVPSTSGDLHVNSGDINSNYEESDDGDIEEEGEFDSLNQNGLIRVDMKKLIDDQTGLPTYEAALKLESSGYV